MGKHRKLILVEGMYVRVSRLGYEDEGIRLTFSTGMPFDFSVEVQLSRRDTEALIKSLLDELERNKDGNLPE